MTIIDDEERFLWHESAEIAKRLNRYKPFEGDADRYTTIMVSLRLRGSIVPQVMAMKVQAARNLYAVAERHGRVVGLDKAANYIV